jgi:hypothetical protein
MFTSRRKTKIEGLFSHEFEVVSWVTEVAAKPRAGGPFPLPRPRALPEDALPRRLCLHSCGHQRTPDSVIAAEPHSQCVPGQSPGTRWMVQRAQTHGAAFGCSDMLSCRFAFHPWSCQAIRGSKSTNPFTTSWPSSLSDAFCRLPPSFPWRRFEQQTPHHLKSSHPQYDGRSRNQQSLRQQLLRAQRPVQGC